jgi:arsenate reductase-like glutaredoxin family protein
MTCKRAQGFLESIDCEVVETVDATKHRLGAVQALALTKGMSQLVAMRGKKVETFDLVEGRPDDATLLSHLLGPTGNLRAPTAKIGRRLVVGFNDETYRSLLGGS